MFYAFVNGHKNCCAVIAEMIEGQREVLQRLVHEREHPPAADVEGVDSLFGDDGDGY